MPISSALEVHYPMPHVVRKHDVGRGTMWKLGVQLRLGLVAWEGVARCSSSLLWPVLASHGGSLMSCLFL